VLIEANLLVLVRVLVLRVKVGSPLLLWMGLTTTRASVKDIGPAAIRNVPARSSEKRTSTRDDKEFEVGLLMMLLLASCWWCGVWNRVYCGKALS